MYLFDEYWERDGKEAICNVEFNSLPEKRKKELKEFSDFLKN